MPQKQLKALPAKQLSQMQNYQCWQNSFCVSLALPVLLWQLLSFERPQRILILSTRELQNLMTLIRRLNSVGTSIGLTESDFEHCFTSYRRTSGLDSVTTRAANYRHQGTRLYSNLIVISHIKAGRNSIIYTRYIDWAMSSSLGWTLQHGRSTQYWRLQETC